jgi:hypothetical protein
MGVKVSPAGNGSSRRSNFTMISDAMAMSIEGRGGSKTTSLDKGRDVVKQDL